MAEGPRGIVGVADAVHRQQHVLYDILDAIGHAVLARGEGAQERQDLPQQTLIGRAVAILCRRH